MAKKEKEPEDVAAVSPAAILDPARPEVQRTDHVLLLVGYRTEPHPAQGEWPPEFEPDSRCTSEESRAKSVETKKAVFAADAGSQPFTARLADLVVLLRDGKRCASYPNPETQSRGPGWLALEFFEFLRQELGGERHDWRVLFDRWPTCRFADFPRREGVVLYGFGIRDFTKIAAAELAQGWKDDQGPFPVPLRFHKDNDLAFDPYQDIVSGEHAKFASLSKVLHARGIGWPGKEAGQPYVPHRDPAEDVRLVAELVSRYNLWSSPWMT